MTHKKFDNRKQSIINRIKQIEENIAIAEAFLETGENAQWSRFKPYFRTKIRDGKELPPHKDWVRNVYLRNALRNLAKTEKLLDRFE